MEHFRNQQWMVDEDGMQSVEPGAPYEYHIEASRLLEKRGAGGGEVYDWPLQLFEKTWIDRDAFIEAYRHAIEVHKKDEVDKEVLEKSIELAYRRRG